MRDKAGAALTARLTWRRALPIAALVAAGYALTLRVFYPGVMTFDAWYMHSEAVRGDAEDWQSPVMTKLWALIDPLAPGAASMFLSIATLYWLAFAVLALALARKSSWLGAAALLLAFAPPAFEFVGIIWRDVPFAASWLLAAALAYAVADRPRDLWRLAAQALALALLCFGFLLRPNGLFAAPILAGYVIWPARFDLKRALILYVPAAATLALTVPLVYYAMLGAKHAHALHSIFVFDLAGITHFTGKNQFPVTWSADENVMLVGPCYKPTDWDNYWTRQPCLFVMKKLDGEKIFGTSTLTRAWLRAIAAHPLAYLEHRAAVMENFLVNQNLTMFTADVEHQGQAVFTDNAWFTALRSVDDWLTRTPFLRAGTWMLFSAMWCLIAWPRRMMPSGAFVLGACGSAVVYMATFFPAGVAGDFRYALWAVLAALAAAAALLARDAKPSARDETPVTIERGRKAHAV
jgi:hypothetical protein